METNAITDLVDRQDWLDPLGEAVQGAVGKVADRAGAPVTDALHGVWLGHPLHPVLTDIPIGAWCVAAALDALEAGGQTQMGPGADAAVAIGLVGAAGSALTGLADYQPLSGKTARRTGAAHMLFNITAVGLYTLSYVCRRTGARGVGRALGWLGLGFMSAGAYLGGRLVYDDRVGVDHAPREGKPRDFVAVMAADELKDGQPARVDVDGISVVLVRQDDRIFAMADTCSHVGGPLSEGEVKDGCISCPWHGSTFRLADGQVVHGPSTYSQAHFATRVRKGQIEIRYDDSVVAV